MTGRSLLRHAAEDAGELLVPLHTDGVAQLGICRPRVLDELGQHRRL